MKIHIPDIATLMVDVGIPFEAQSRYLEVAVARTLAYNTAIPAEPVASTREFFKGTLEGQIAPALDSLVERIPLDVKNVLELTYQIWELRYGLVHPQTNALAWALLDAVSKKANIVPDIDFTDPTLARLSSVIASGLEK